jgi:hypothetical protein
MVVMLVIMMIVVVMMFMFAHFCFPLLNRIDQVQSSLLDVCINLQRILS